MIKIFLVCPGLGNINRGYESFTRECFDALVTEPQLQVTLWKGGGKPFFNERRVWNLPRQGRFANLLGRITRRGSYFIEQATFSLFFLPQVFLSKPDVVYFSDGNIGNWLWHWRRLTRGQYKLLFSNGGPLSPPFPRWDFVQQVAPPHFDEAAKAGQPAEKQAVVPYGIRVEADFRILSDAERAELRKKLDLPLDRPVVVSVAALNKTHKRMDYLIREVAALPEPRPFLLMLGQSDEETPEIAALAVEKLGAPHFALKTVPADHVAEFYRAADVFVLTSLREGFGRVFLEAMAQGLPCLAHDYDVARYVLGEFGHVADFSQNGGLTTLLQQVLEGEPRELSRARHRDVFDRFSWEKLRPSYLAMIERCAHK